MMFSVDTPKQTQVYDDTAFAFAVMLCVEIEARRKEWGAGKSTIKDCKYHTKIRFPGKPVFTLFDNLNFTGSYAKEIIRAFHHAGYPISAITKTEMQTIADAFGETSFAMVWAKFQRELELLQNDEEQV